MKEKAGGVGGFEEKRGIEGGILSFEDKELKKEQKVEEQQGRRRLQPVFCFHKMTTVTSHSILACTKENCEEHNHKKTNNKIIHFKKNKYQSNTNARCKYTL